MEKERRAYRKLSKTLDEGSAEDKNLNNSDMRYNDCLCRLKDRKRLDRIPYNINSYSSFSSTYSPTNILINDPNDVNSRWSTNTNDHRQYIIIEYDPAVVSNIQFGKYSKIHVCNIKEMKISVSIDNITYEEVFYGGLRNDTQGETFNLIYYRDGRYIVSKYMMIEPLAAWGMNFNYSIWYIELKGILDSLFLSRSEEIRKQEEVIGSLKILKREGYKLEVDEIAKDMAVSNKDIEIIRKYFEKSEYEKCEEFIKEMDGTKFRDYIDSSGYKGIWKKIAKSLSWPCERGGHQMISMKGHIYLYGGWNGKEELGDFWLFNTESMEWKCIHDCVNDLDTIIDDINYSLSQLRTEDLSSHIHDMTPGKRSCHKMCTDGDRIFILGRYIPNIVRDVDFMYCDIWMYDGKWSLLGSSTRDLCPNMYDHNLVYEGGYLYMFGGKTTNYDDSFGGLYKIDVRMDIEKEELKYTNKEDEICMENLNNKISNESVNTQNNNKTNFISIRNKETNTKKSLDSSSVEFNDLEFDNSINKNYGKKMSLPRRWYKILDGADQPSDTPCLKGRLGHGLIYVDVPDTFYTGSLAIIGGQRGKEYFKNISFYSEETDTVYETVPYPIYSDGRILQRSVLYKSDILVLFTYGKDRDSKLDIFKLFTYSLTNRMWSEVQMNTGPSARTAHQFINHNNTLYLFGGNVVDKRQNDLWSLNLNKQTVEEIKHIMIMKIRQHKYLDLLNKNMKKEALNYLKTKLKELVNDIETKEIFESMCLELFERKYVKDLVEDLGIFICKGHII